MKIAVFVDDAGWVAPLWQSGTVQLFTREAQQWRVCQQFPFALTPELSLAEIRERTLSLLAQLPECRHFVAQDIHGALLAWLDGKGLTMWKCIGHPLDALDRIAAQIPPAPEPVVLHPEVFIEPGEEEGQFRVDLIEALRGGGAHTSKRVLMPFFEQRQFTRLEIVCDHLPKWFSSLDPTRLHYQVMPAVDGVLRVIVTPVTAGAVG